MRRPPAQVRPDHPRRSRRAGAAAQALPLVLFHTPCQHRHDRLSAGHPRLPARLLPSQERGLGSQQAAQADRLDRHGTREDADLLRDGAGQDHAAVGGPAHAERRRDRRLRMAARRGARRVRCRVRPNRVPGRPAELSGAHQRPFRGRAGSVRGPNHRPAVTASSQARAIGASTRPQVCSSVCRKRSARACWPAIWSTAPATGCSRSSRRQPAACSSSSCARPAPANAGGRSLRGRVGLSSAGLSGDFLQGHRSTSGDGPRAGSHPRDASAASLSSCASLIRLLAWLKIARANVTRMASTWLGSSPKYGPMSRHPSSNARL